MVHDAHRRTRDRTIGDHLNGFTLVELLVVVTIVTLLMAILAGGLASARDASRQTQCLINLKDIGLQLTTYAAEHDGRLPYGYRDAGPSFAGSDWSIILNAAQRGGGATYADAMELAERFRCPASALRSGSLTMSANPRVLPNVSDGLAPFQPVALADIKRLSQIIVTMDGAQDPSAIPAGNATATAWRTDAGALLFNPSLPANRRMPIDPGPDQDTPAGAGDVRWRHTGSRSNFGFADGHSASMGKRHVLKDFLYPPY